MGALAGGEGQRIIQRHAGLRNVVRILRLGVWATGLNGGLYHRPNWPTIVRVIEF